MSKFGWSYPPGVTESMLPGNTPADQAAEALADAVYGLLDKYQIKLPEVIEGNLVLEVMKMIEDSYGNGYAEGASDERQATEFAAKDAMEQ